MNPNDTNTNTNQPTNSRQDSMRHAPPRGHHDRRKR